MIRNIVLDMGRVLIHWSGEQLLEDYPLSGEEKALLLRELFGSIEWVQLDRGSITEEAAIRSVCRRLPAGLHGTVRELVTTWWHRPLRPMEGMDRLVRELKGLGYGIYVLSNASLALRQYWVRLPGADCFDGVVVSAEEKLLKPQPEIYHTLLSRYGLRPEECVFVDDAVANAEGAVHCGMAAIVFRGSAGQLRQGLRQLGIPCEEE